MRVGYRYIDYMLLMTYNYHGSGWEMTTGHHSPILPHRRDPPGDQRELYLVSDPLPVCQNLSHKNKCPPPPTHTHTHTLSDQRELYLVSGPFAVCQNLSHKEDTVGTPPTPTHPPTINENSTS